jgi:hypothetical protein
MTARTEIHAAGTFNDRTGVGGWAAVVEAVKMAEGPCTVISDYQWLVQNAQQGKTQPTCQPLWEELSLARRARASSTHGGSGISRSGRGWPTISRGTRHEGSYAPDRQ